jgi:hypothetical protein
MLGSLARLSIGIAIGSALCLSVPLCAGRALAAGLTAKETAKAKQAKQLYKEGEYEQAAKLFSSLSSDHPEMLVFTRNLGACYYYLRRPEPALSNLREYLRREQDITPEDRSEVEGWMAEMEKLRGHLHALSVAPVAPPPEAASTVTSPALAPAPSPPTPLPPPAFVGAAPVQSAASLSPSVVSQAPSSVAPSVGVTTAAQPPARSNKTLAWITGGVGAAGLVAGGVFTGLALSKFSSTESQYNPSDESAGKTYAALQWVGYAVGVAGIGTAIVLFALDSKPTGSVALTPMLGQGFAGASVAGTY